MLLAAGEGQRLRPLTEHMPKPMLRVTGRPILEYNVRLLAHYGVREIMVNLHHCPEAVTGYFGDGSQWGVSLHYSFEETLLGTAGAIKRVQDFFDGSFLVMYGDNLTNCDLCALQEKHRAASAVATVALFYRQDVSASGVALLDNADRITGFIEKPQTQPPPSHWVNAGLFVLEVEIFKFIPGDGPADFGFDVLPDVINRGLPVYGYRMNEGLWWADTPDDYQQLCLMADRGELKLI